MDTTCRWFKIDPTLLIAHPRALNPRFARLSPAGLGATGRNVTKKRISNVKTDVRRALEWAGCLSKSSYFVKPTTAWSKLLEQSKHYGDHARFARLTKYCTVHGIEPDNLPVDLGMRFYTALVDEALVGTPQRTARNAIQVLNRLIKQGAVIRQSPLPVPGFYDTYILKADRFPESFQRAVDAFLDLGSCADEFDLSGRDHPIRPITAAVYRDRLYRTASLMVLAGRDVANIRSLSDLVDMRWVTLAMRYLRDRRENRQPRAQIGALLETLVNISANHVHWADKKSRADNVDSLLRLTRRFRKGPGLSKTVRERLGPLKNDANLARLFLLGSTILKELKKLKSLSRRDAVKGSLAVVLSILTYCPLRIGSICKMRLDQHLQWSSPAMKGDLSLVFAEGELKNGEPGSYPLPSECAQAIRWYIVNCRPLLLTNDSPFLFPSSDVQRPKLKGEVSQQVRHLIHYRIGLDVNPHLFRHVVHLVVLRRFPGAYALISRILSHRSLETALRNYSYLAVEMSMKVYQALVRDASNGSARVRAAPDGQVANQQGDAT